MVGLATVFGAGGGTSSYQEAEAADVIVMWGSNARNAHPIFFHHVLKAIHNGAKLYSVDPRRSETAQFADRWLGLHVGTDVALSNTIAREIIRACLEGALPATVASGICWFSSTRRSTAPGAGIRRSRSYAISWRRVSSIIRSICT